MFLTIFSVFHIQALKKKKITAETYDLNKNNKLKRHFSNSEISARKLMQENVRIFLFFQKSMKLREQNVH